ncbi:hypothetical protein RPPS3_25960 [Rhodopseudomonas palustris]|uniref:hypothetical protein n=1 Tax=Rhodopseudomonas palustris TaxID=1076 RepID=UPI000D20684B|nr:hypothetical protein [Rhodopseudomonas palustris]AVT76659.1 hypothetical protein RPPS3_25960 [Rhodopseudomonas palustris]
MSETLRIDLTEHERDGKTIAFEFEIVDGNVRITEHWSEEDESYGPGCRINIPPRVWALGCAWVQQRRGGATSLHSADPNLLIATIS